MTPFGLMGQVGGVLGLRFIYGDEPRDCPKLLLALVIISEGWVEVNSSPARNAHFALWKVKHPSEGWQIPFRILANSIKKLGVFH